MFVVVVIVDDTTMLHKLSHAQCRILFTFQLIGSLKAVADQMRTCATMAEHFVQSLSHVPFGGPVPLGQYPVPPPATPVPAGRKRRTAEEMSTDGKRKRKPPKDPNAPKRPASSYLIFQNDVRNELKKEHPNLSNNELLSMIAALWQNMPKEKKEVSAPSA